MRSLLARGQAFVIDARQIRSVMDIDVVTYEGVSLVAAAIPPKIWHAANQVLCNKFGKGNRVGDARMLELSAEPTGLGAGGSAAGEINSRPSPHILWIPGGNPESVLGDSHLHLELQRLHGSAQVTVATGAGLLLAAASGLVHRPVAAEPEIAVNLAQWVPQVVADQESPIVDAGDLVTAREGEEEALALYLLAVVGGAKLALATADALELPRPSRAQVRVLPPPAGEGIF